MANQQIQRSSKQLLDLRLPNMLSVVPESERDRFKLAAYAVCLNSAYHDCTPESVLSSIFYCFRWGLVPDPAMKQVYIVPFKDKGVKKAQPILGYNGLIDLARNADPSLVVRTGCVFDNDDFHFTDGTERSLMIYKPHWIKGELPGRLLFSWCSYKVSSQSIFETVVVPAAKLEALRDKKKDSGGATTWGNPENYPAMCEKTAIRQAAKKWTLAPHTEAGKRLRQAVTDDELIEQNEPLEEYPGEPEPLRSGTKAVAAMLAKRKGGHSEPAPIIDTVAYSPSVLAAGAEWDDFVNALVMAAKSSPLNTLENVVAIRKAVGQFVVRLGAVHNENQIDMNTRISLYNAAENGELTPDGRILSAKENA